ncbi:hypothetical protein Tco_0413361 [Tanacetum coccineum]
MGSGLLPENAPPLGSFVVGAQNLPCSFLGVRFLRTHENNLKLEGPGTSGSGSQNRARALEVTVAGIIFSLALTESISSKGMTSALIWQVSSGSSESGNATSLPALESSSSSESLATRDYYNLPPQNNPGEYEGLVRDHLDQALNVPHYRNILDMEYFELTVLERKGLLQDRLFNLMLGEQNLSRIMELSPYTNIRREAYDFLEAPVLLKWFVSRDVPTGAPSSNGTIIPIPIPSFPLLVYLHSRKFIRSTDGAKSGVLVRASRPILLPDIIGRSSSETRARKALFRFVPVLHFLLIEKKGDFSYLESFCGVLRLLFFRTFFSLPRDRSAKRERARRRKGQPNGNEQGRNDKMRCPGHPHLERRVEVFGPVALPVPPSSGGACVGGAPAEIGLEALTLPTSRQLMAVGHDYYKKAPMKMNISHGGVCIFMLGVLLSCDPAAYVRPVAHASYLFRAGGVNSDSIRVTPVGEVALSIPSGQPGREHGGDGLPKKPARAGYHTKGKGGREATTGEKQVEEGLCSIVESRTPSQRSTFRSVIVHALAVASAGSMGSQSRFPSYPAGSNQQHRGSAATGATKTIIERYQDSTQTRAAVKTTDAVENLSFLAKGSCSTKQPITTLKRSQGKMPAQISILDFFS